MKQLIITLTMFYYDYYNILSGLIMVLGNYWPNFIMDDGRGVFEEQLHCCKIRGVDHLRERLIEE